MKLLLLLFGLATAAAAFQTAGYKPYGKYIYNYTATLDIALGPDKEQYTGLKINASVELHFLPNYEVLLWIPDTTVSDVILDPKYSFVPNVTESVHGEIIAKYLAFPVKFGYRNGLVNRVYNHADDTTWSMNMKKSIINLLHIDVMGKDQETGEKLLFTKEEMSIYGICNTTYSMKDYSVFDVNRMVKIGMNITKVIDTSNCTMYPADQWSSISADPINADQENPLKTSTIIKYNLIGNEVRFKLQQVNATGRFVFVPFSEREGSVVAATSQIFTFVSSGASTIKRDNPTWFNFAASSTLISDIKKTYPAEFPQQVPSVRTDLVKDINDVISKISDAFKSEITTETPLKLTMPEIFLRLVNSLRLADEEAFNLVWTHCEGNEDHMKWFFYGLSLTGNEQCVHFIEEKVKSGKVPIALVREFIDNLGFVTRPSLPWLKEVKKLCSIKLVKEDPYLNQTCVIVISNIIKGYCDIVKHCSPEIDQTSPSIKSYLEYITSCDSKTTTCWNEVQMMPVLVAAENLGFVSYWTHLEKIITTPSYPLAIRARAIVACRKIIKTSPIHVRATLFRMFRDVTEQVELRSLAFDVLMENPTPNMIKICASTLYQEPSNEVRGFVLSKINSILVLNPYMVGKDIYAACVISKKIYFREFSRLLARSQHTHYVKNFYSNLRILGYKTEMYTNSTYIPRYVHTGINVTLFGRTFSLIDGEVRIEGLQEFLTKFVLPSSDEPQKSLFETVKSKIQETFSMSEELRNVNTKLPVKPRVEESLKLFTSLKLFNRMYYFNYSTYDSNIGWKELLFKDIIFRAASLEKEFKNGKVFKFSKPMIPVEVVYTVPTNVGLPLTLNATVIALVNMHTEMKAEVKPSLFSRHSLLTKEKESFEATVINNVTAVSQTLASMYFDLPITEIGVSLNKTMNITKCTKANVFYNFKTKEYKIDYQMPETDYSLLEQKSELYNYIRVPNFGRTKQPELYAMKKHNITFDRFGTFMIANGSEFINTTTRHAVWSFKMDETKYLCVVNKVVTTCEKPYLFNVIFHGDHRRIVSLYAPGVGYVTMSHKSTCLFIKPKLTNDYSKLFVLDYTRPFEIRLKTLVRMPKRHWPVNWDMPNVEDYMHLKEVEELYMRERVAMEKEDLTEEEIYPEDLAVRVVYLKVSQAKTVCTTPKLMETTPYKIIVNRTVEEVVRNISLSTGYCIGASWGINACFHAYGSMPMLWGAPLLQQLVSPSDYSVWVHRNVTNTPKSISLTVQKLENTWESTKYKMMVRLVGTVPERSIMAHADISRSLLERKFRLVVDPTHEELLSFKKTCISFVSKADYFRWAVSMHPTCLVPHLTMDVLTTKSLPRHRMTFRLNHTYVDLPMTYQRIFNNVSSLFHFAMRMRSTHFYGSNNTKLNGPNSTHFTMFLTRPQSMDIMVKTNDRTYDMRDIRLPHKVRTFPKGSPTRHLSKKLSNDFMKPKCVHKNNTFTTFDDVKYNFNLSAGCEHVLLRNCNRNVTNFAVLVKRHPTYYRMRIVTILVGSHKIEIIPTNSTLPPTFKINDKEEQLSAENFYMVKVSPESKIPLMKIKWEPTLLNFVVKYYKGLDLLVELHEGWKVKASVTPLFVGKTCGLCGNYDMEQHREFQTPEHYITDNPTIFGYSWTLPGVKCKTGCPLKTDFLDVTKKAMLERKMLCFTKYRLPTCLPTCKIEKKAFIRIPTVCVMKSYSQMLKTSLIHGEPITIRSAEHYETKVEYPVSCSCPCENNKYPIKETKPKSYEEYFTGLFFDF